MEKSKRKNGEIPIRVFNKNISDRVEGLAPIFLVIMAGTLGFSLESNDAKWMIILLLLSLASIGIIFLITYSETLTIYKEGIEYQHQGKYIFVKWQQLSHFESHKDGRKSEQGIKIHSSVSQEKVENFVDDQIYRKPFDDFIPVSRVTEIPIKAMREGVLIIDLRRLKSTEFGRLINEYAPHLFEGEGS